MKVIFEMHAGSRMYVFDLDDPRDVKNLGYDEEEWNTLNHSEKQRIAEETLIDHVEIFYDEE